MRPSRRLRRELARLKGILDRPDPRDFMRASEIEARFQLDKWGTADGEPIAFGGQSDDCFAALIVYLTDKALRTSPDEGLDKKLHRITTIAAAAANWHMLAARESGESR